MAETKEGEQYHIRLKRGDVGKYVLLTGDPGRVPKIASFFENARHVATNREYTTYTGEIDGIKVSSTSTGIGCPSAAICMEELARVGADTFIRIGTAGSLQKHVKVGDLVILTATVREDGTSRQYVPLSYPAVADFEVTLALKQAAEKLGYRYHIGIGHTKDAFYTEEAEGLPLEREIMEEWETWRKANVLCTSMESSALFTIGSIRGLKIGTVLACIGTTRKGKLAINTGTGAVIEKAAKVGVETVRILKRGPGQLGR